MTIDDQIAVLTAFRDGKKIERRIIGRGKWEPCETLQWNFYAHNYRVAPLAFPELPAGEEWHNPCGLSPEQVGEDHRPLTKREHADRCSKYNRDVEILPKCELWNDFMSEWQTGFDGTYQGETYRIPRSTPFLSAPEPPGYWDSPADVPLNCWIKTPAGNASLIVHVATEGVGCAGPIGSITMTWEELKKTSYSTDRVNWKECRKS